MSLYSFSACEEVTFSSGCPLTHGLVAAFWNDDQKGVNQFTSMIHARNDMNKNPDFIKALGSFEDIGAQTGGKIAPAGNGNTR